MKSEHRHELKTNELGQLAQRMMPFLEKNGTRILVIFSAVAFVSAITIYWVRSSRATTYVGWARVAAARSAEDFANVADDFPGSKVAAWARLNEAERHLQNGIRLMFTDRAAGVSDLSQARSTLEELLAERGIPDQVREGARFRLARCLESEIGENTDAAIDAYEQLLQEYPESMYKESAETRVAALRTQEAKNFYAWFQKQNPKPPDIEKPNDGAASEDAATGDVNPSLDVEEVEVEVEDAKESDALESSSEDEAAAAADDDSSAQDSADEKQGPTLPPADGGNPGQSDDAPPSQ
jgi:hypothetical protein